MGAGWLLTLALAASCAREATPVPGTSTLVYLNYAYYINILEDAYGC